jgi:cell division protein FtsB
VRGGHLSCASLDPKTLLSRALPACILGLAVVSVPVLVLRPDGLPQMRVVEKELASVQAENRGLRRDVGDLKNEVRHLRDDPAAVEHIAREQLGMVRKSEVVFQFPKQ